MIYSISSSKTDPANCSKKGYNNKSPPKWNKSTNSKTATATS